MGFGDDMNRRSVPSAFDQYSRPGTTVEITLYGEPDVRPVTDMKTGEVKFFKDGVTPRTQYVLEGMTSLRGAQLDDGRPDDGSRRIYVKSWNMKRLREAVKAAGLATLAEGDVVIDTFVREDATTAEKVHSYVIKPGPNAVRAGTVPAHGAARTAVGTMASSPATASNDEPPF